MPPTLRILLFLVCAILASGGFVAKTFAQSAGSAGDNPSCLEVPGAITLFDRPQIHVVWIGELHGTNEMPAMFGDLACAAGMSGRTVIIALERNTDEQPLWDAWLKSDGSNEAERSLLGGSDWSNEQFRNIGKDGRSSEAMLGLAERLRTYKKKGLILDIRVFRPALPAMPADGNLDEVVNEGMAQQISNIVEQYPNALVLAYSGGVHGRRNMRPGLNFHPAASLLPPAQLLSVRLVGGDGEAWNCGGNECKTYSTRGVVRPRGIVFAENVTTDKDLLSDGGFDALAFTGVRSTASLPAQQP